jgi:N-acetyltransferase
MFITTALTLEDARVKLIPLSTEHHFALARLIEQDELHLLWYTKIPEPKDLGEEIKRRLHLQEAGTMVALTVLDKHSESPVGMTTYMNIEPSHKRLEIGSTWLCHTAQRCGINTAMKYLMLEYAFEAMECIAVEFRTHFLNKQSRRAIERLGAKLDGVLRSHQIMPDATLRDTCVYSITQAEWPAVKKHLNFLKKTKYAIKV